MCCGLVLRKLDPLFLIEAVEGVGGLQDQSTTQFLRGSLQDEEEVEEGDGGVMGTTVGLQKEVKSNKINSCEKPKGMCFIYGTSFIKRIIIQYVHP